MLSRPPGVDQGKDNNQGMSVIPPGCFINMAQMKEKLSETQKWSIMAIVHDYPIAEHPSWDKTIWKAKTH